jgi:hypothetical protein
MTRLLPILVLLTGCTTDAQIDAFASRMESAVLAYEQSQERMAAEIRLAALPPFPEDAPQPKLGWDQDDVENVAGWHVYINDVRAQTVITPRIEIPDALGVIRLTVTAFNAMGMESEPSEPFWITNTPPLKNVVITITATLVLTNPVASMQLFSLCVSTNPAGVWKPHAADLRIQKTHF